METTITGNDGTHSQRSSDALAPLPALVLLWSHEEPERVSEVCFLVAAVAEHPILLGRASVRPGERCTRLEWVRQRPGRIEPTGPLRNPRISREQLRLRPQADGTVVVENIGRLRLLHQGAPVDEARLSVGELLELEKEALLLFVHRPAMLSATGLDRSTQVHPFGEADADGIVGESPAAWELRARVAFVGARRTHVLIRGDSGTGKELVAQAIHRRSERASRPLVSRNAATIPETLVDAELFGHARNYPNAGMPERPGLIGEADGSTLFLDEFAELPPALQAHLLRVLDQGEYQRLGESRARHADFRLIAATNRPESALKHDVLARLQVRVELPGLNERREDIPLLARHLLRRIGVRDPEIARRFFADGDPAGQPLLTPALVARLVGHAYTTHVRELEALLWTAMLRSQGSRLDLWVDAASPSSPPSPARAAEPARAAVDPFSLRPEEIQACLDRHGGRQEPAWRELGLSSRHVLARLVDRYGLRVRGRSGGFKAVDDPKTIDDPRATDEPDPA